MRRPRRHRKMHFNLRVQRAQLLIETAQRGKCNSSIHSGTGDGRVYFTPSPLYASTDGKYRELKKGMWSGPWMAYKN